MSNNILKKQFPYTYSSITFYLIGINILFYMLNIVYPRSVFYTAMIPGLVTQKFFIWQFVTYMFTHANFSHILFNMLGLFFFGVQVERRMGSYEFLLFYLVSGFLAGLFSFFVYILTGSYAVILLGASGAVFAVLFAFAVYFPYAKIYIMGIIPVKAPILVIGYAALELFSQLTSSRMGVAHLTHLAGFGFAYLYFVVRLGINPLDSFKSGRSGPWGN
ncbi:MAG: rhomboid family intramembrane serine protease [Spirochaetes bacterium]|nr:MAG: rhomboid family intramembrane serine protease [Spirochaetota bacterium]